MKKGLLAIPVGGVVAALVAIGASSIKPWSWDESTRNDTINYCLLIGQTDHNDSQARTKGIREKLGTLLHHEEGEKYNPNAEGAKTGKLKFTLTDGGTKTYTVNELEAKTCVADTGATWDQGTAVITCNNWYSKYKGNLTMVVSNNDGMAEGASFALNCPKGLPIFGYDSNKSTLGLIIDGQIAGTINSNAPAQAAAMNIIACRILDPDCTYDPDAELTAANGLYNTIFKGFWIDDPNDKTKSLTAKGDDDYVSSNGKGNGYITDILGDVVHFKYNPDEHSLLVSSKDIWKKDTAKDFLMDEKDQFDKIGAHKPKTRTNSYSFFQSCYSKTDTYLTTTMNPLLKAARHMFNIAEPELDSMAYGNGNDEDEITNKLQSMSAQQAYLINMTKTVNADKYVSSLDEDNKPVQGEIEKKVGTATYTGSNGKRLPIIFYNRQPSDDNGVNTKAMHAETNGGNKYTFYVGFDAVSGAELQGTMIQDWLKDKIGASKVEVIE